MTLEFLFHFVNNSPDIERPESDRTVYLFCDYCTISSHRQPFSYLCLCLNSNGRRLSCFGNTPNKCVFEMMHDDVRLFVANMMIHITAIGQ